MNTTSTLSFRSSAYYVKELLDRGMPLMVFEKFGQAKPLPAKNTKTISFRRYMLKNNGYTSGAFQPGTYFGGPLMLSTVNARTPSDNSDQDGTRLTEGVTPKAVDLMTQDITATLIQYGSVTDLSDVVLDTLDIDNPMQEATTCLAEQAANVLEDARFEVLKGCSNKYYSNGSKVADVNTKLTYTVCAKVLRGLKRQLARPITAVTKSSTNYGTEGIAPAYVAVVHPDLEYDIRAMSGFVGIESYAGTPAFDGEIGKVGEIRFVSSTKCAPLTTLGATGGTNVLEDSSTNKAIVYPVLFFGKDAYGLVPFKGMNAAELLVSNPTPSDSDPLAQRGHVGWKAMSTTVILNDAWMAIGYVACSSIV